MRSNAVRKIEYFEYCSVSPDSAAYFADLWGTEPDMFRENIIARQGFLKKSWLLDALRDEKKRQRFFGQFWSKDAYFSPNSFRPCGDQSGCAEKSNLSAVYSWAIDIDYRKTYGYGKEPLAFYENIVAPVLGFDAPIPNWIEYGHQLRLIYVLEKPIVMKTGKSLASGIEKVQKELCKRLNDEIDCNAEPQKLNSYYRIPGSINSKNGAVVCVKHISSDKWTAQELMNEYLPEMPTDGNARKPKTTVSKKGKVSVIHNQYSLCSERIEALKNLRNKPDIARELLCFVFGATWLTINEGDAVAELQEFNKGFANPLPEKEIRSKFRTLKKYSFKNGTICDLLGLSDSDLKRYDAECFGLSKRAREKAEKEAAGTTRKQIANRNYENLKQLYIEGYRGKDLAEKSGYTEKSVKIYVNRIRKELGISRSKKEAVTEEPKQETKQIEKTVKEPKKTAEKPVKQTGLVVMPENIVSFKEKWNDIDPDILADLKPFLCANNTKT